MSSSLTVRNPKCVVLAAPSLPVDGGGGRAEAEEGVEEGEEDDEAMIKILCRNNGTEVFAS